MPEVTLPIPRIVVNYFNTLSPNSNLRGYNTPRCFYNFLQLDDAEMEMFLTDRKVLEVIANIKMNGAALKKEKEIKYLQETLNQRKKELKELKRG